MKKLICLLTALLLVALPLMGVAETDFPKKEITIIVPFSPGGATDLMTRELQPIFKSKLNVDIVVEDVPGGGSVTGIMQAMTSKPDGYTLALVTSSYIALAAQDQVPLPLDTFTNITTLSEDPLCIVVKAKSAGGKYGTIQELLEDMKARPGEVVVAQAGNNNANQACVGVLSEEAGVEINNIPYDGASRVVTEIIGGHIEAGCMKPGDCLSQVQAGEIAILGFFTRERVALYPDVPTFAELGYDIFKYGDIAMVTFLAAPAGTDPEVAAKLSQMFYEVLSSEEWQAVAAARSFVTVPISGEELKAYVASVYEGLKVAAEKIFQ